MKELLDQYGSDKATRHNYHHLYGTLLEDRTAITGIFEVGLGTNNPTVVSNMGGIGRPGSSLRAFRDFAPNAHIYGADVDKAILFNEDRIVTHFVDQTDPATFEALKDMIPNGIDLVIDDGLHAPDANIATLTFGLSRIKAGGWVIIEDIPTKALALWDFIGAILPRQFEPTLFELDLATLFGEALRMKCTDC